MPQYDGYLVFDTAVDQTGLQKGLKESESLFSVFGGNFLANLASQTFNQTMSAAKGFITQGVGLASDLGEIKNVVDVTFGSASETIYKWAKDAKENFGIAELAASEYLGSLGAMMKSVGDIDTSELTELSTLLVGTIGDVSSFYNKSQSLVYQDVVSGVIAQQTEAIRKYGVNMTVAALDAYTLEKGLDKMYSTMSNKEQLLTRIQFFTEKVSDAQGDFALTSDSFANQQRVLDLSLKEVSQTLGEAFLPSMKKVINYTLDNLPKLTNIAEDVGKGIGSAIEFIVDYGDEIVKVTGTTLAFGAAYKSIVAIMMAKNSIENVIDLWRKLNKAETETAIALNVFKNADKYVPGATLAEHYDRIAKASADVTDATNKQKEAQIALNSAMGFNPAALAVGGLVALAAGIAIARKEATKFADEIKEINEEWVEASALSDENRVASEAEAETVRIKAEQYEKLRAEYDATCKGGEQLKILAEDLQKVMPDEIDLIDEATGAYNSLAGSIDSVVEAMLRQSELNAFTADLDNANLALRQYKEEAKTLQTQFDEMGGMEEYQEKLAQAYFSPGVAIAFPWETTIIDIKKSLDDAKKGEVEAQAAVDRLKDEMYGTLGADTNTISTSTATLKQSTQEYNEAVKKAQEDRLKTLQKAWDNLDHAYAMREADDEDAEHRLQEGRKNALLNWGLPDDENYRSYYEQLAAMDREAAEDLIKQQKEDAEKVAEEYEKAANVQKSAISDAIKGVLTSYQDGYKTLQSEMEAYRKRVLGVGGDLFSISDQEDGSRLFQVNNIQEQIQKMRDYAADIESLRNRGFGASLFEELNGLNAADSAIMADQIANMSGASQEQLKKALDERQSIEDELVRKSYEDDFAMLQRVFGDNMATVAKENYGYGAMSANEYYKGFMEEWRKLSATMKTDVLGEQTRYLRSFGFGSGSSSQPTIKVETNPIFSSQPILTQVTNDIILDDAKIGKSVTEWQLTQQIITGG